MLEKMYWVCSDAVTLGGQLSSADNLPSLEVLQRRIESLFEDMGHRARQVQVPAEDVMEAKYALCAFMDEQILRSPWPGRTQWMGRPLQLVYFNETTAGEGFYHRLQALQSSPHRAHVAMVYYLCIALGFQGMYAVRGSGELDVLTEQLQRQVMRKLPAPDTISPHGEPRDRVAGGAGRQLPWIGLSIAMVVAALLALIVMRVLVSSSAARAADQMRRVSDNVVHVAQQEGWS
ncbi:MAG: type IVB secretion system protein IcmH/DotU [Polyangiaceae bacterium]|nr:type IVB secretion system protein IcmH/DotU [Polyangiaceae bacterium]